MSELTEVQLANSGILLQQERDIPIGQPENESELSDTQLLWNEVIRMFELGIIEDERHKERRFDFRTMVKIYPENAEISSNIKRIELINWGYMGDTRDIFNHLIIAQDTAPSLERVTVYSWGHRPPSTEHYGPESDRTKEEIANHVKGLKPQSEYRSAAESAQPPTTSDPSSRAEQDLMLKQICYETFRVLGGAIIKQGGGLAGLEKLATEMSIAKEKQLKRSKTLTAQVRRLLRYMIVSLHPDTPNGDEELCKSVTDVYNRINKNEI